LKWTGYRKIPKKVVTNGNTGIAKMAMGIADSQLVRLENDMSHQGIGVSFSTKSYQVAGKRVVIEAWSSLNLQGVVIHVLEKGEQPGVGKKCFCSCHVAEGVITVPKRTMGICNQVDTVYSTCYYHLSMFGEPVTYDVSVCMNKTHSITIENCITSDFTKYVNNERVMVLWMPEVGQTYDIDGNGCFIETCMIIPMVPA
jgi:hypothetical protein